MILYLLSGMIWKLGGINGSRREWGNGVGAGEWGMGDVKGKRRLLEVMTVEMFRQFLEFILNGGIMNSPLLNFSGQ